MKSSAMPFDDQILYLHKNHGRASDRLSLYRIIAQGLGWVRVAVNDGNAVNSKPATLDSEEFDRTFTPTTERIESR